MYINNEGMTNMEASAILPVLYDSSLTNKAKITDLLGIPVNDASYNQILNVKNKDPDDIIAYIKLYINSSVTFKETPKDNTLTAPPTSSTDSTPSVSDATTTTPTNIKDFKDKHKGETVDPIVLK
jgi:hypothetical protein